MAQALKCQLHFSSVVMVACTNLMYIVVMQQNRQGANTHLAVNVFFYTRVDLVNIEQGVGSLICKFHLMV